VVTWNIVVLDASLAFLKNYIKSRIGKIYSWRIVCIAGRWKDFVVVRFLSRISCRYRVLFIITDCELASKIEYEKI